MYCVRVQCEMLCSHPPPHSSLTHAHFSSGRQVSSSATAKASANRGRGGGGGDGQPVDEYQGPHESVCVCVKSNKVDTLSSYPTSLGSVCQVRLVPASMSCTVSVQKVTAGDQTWSVSCPSCPCSLCSPLVSTSSPPTTATNTWTYLTRSALPCVVLGVSTHMFVVGIVHVCGGQCTCVCLHTCTYVYVLLLYTYVPTVLIFATCYIQSFMVACKTAKDSQVT